jgi:hypothetical protein
MAVGAVLIAVTGVVETLGGALLTQRGADRAKRREVEMSQTLREARGNRELRRRCYSELHRDARQFATALSRHLYVLRDRGPRRRTFDRSKKPRTPTATAGPRL